MSTRSPVQTKHLDVLPMVPELLKLAKAYAVQEQFLLHSAAHWSKLLSPTSRNLSGSFTLGMVTK